MIRTLFLGTPEFAVPSLRSLAEQADIEIALVVTQPDRRAGRGRGMRPPAVKVAAEELSLPLLQPETLRDTETIEHLRAAEPDVIVVVSYGEILRGTVLELPEHGCLNVHPSLLPAYRGSAPIPAAILNGDEETGVSFMRLVRRMDAGPIVSQIRTPLEGVETTRTLTERLAHEAARALPNTVRAWVEAELQEQPQHERDASYTRELRKADAQVDWTHSAGEIERFVRAMDPWPRAWTIINGARLALHETHGPVDAVRNSGPGSLIIEENTVYVGTGEGMLELVTVQPEGKKPMTAGEWLRGARIESGSIFDSPIEPASPLIFKR